MNIDSSGLAMMDFTPNYCRIGISFHFKTCYPVSVDVAAFKITLKTQNMQSSVRVLLKIKPGFPLLPPLLNAFLI